MSFLVNLHELKIEWKALGDIGSFTRGKRFVKTDLQFCGLIMGDYAKSAINTQFNTGTVVGVCANVFQSGFPPNMIKHYSWGGQSDAPVFNFDKACEAAEKMMERREKMGPPTGRGPSIDVQ